MNENENKIYQNLWKTVKAITEGEIYSTKACTRKELKSMTSPSTLRNQTNKTTQKQRSEQKPKKYKKGKQQSKQTQQTQKLDFLYFLEYGVDIFFPIPPTKYKQKLDIINKKNTF